MTKYHRFLAAIGFGFFLLPWSIAQERPLTPREKEWEKIQAGIMFEQLQSRLPPKPPEDATEVMKVWRDVHEYLQGPARSRLTSMLTDRNPAVRREAALTLAELTRNSDYADATIENLAKRLGDRDIEVRAAAFWALGRMAPHGKSEVPKAIEALKHEDARIRRGAYQVISHWLPFDKEMVPHVIAALDDPDMGPWKHQPGINSVSHLAISNLGRSNLGWRERNVAKQAAPKLIKIVQSRKGCEGYESSALNALANVAPEESFTVDLAKAWLKEKEVRIAQKGARLLYVLGPFGKEAVPELIAAAMRPADPDPANEQAFKMAIAFAFEKLGASAQAGLPALEELSRTQDLTLRRQVLLAIDSIKPR